MRRMLDPKEVGGGSLPSTITFDGDGNRKVGKNLGVDGKLTLKSLVSASNPDGDITKELGGGGGGGSMQLYHHHIYLYYEYVSDRGYIYFDYDYTNAENFTVDTLIATMQGKTVICSGYLIVSSKRVAVEIKGNKNKLQVGCYPIEGTIPGVPDEISINKDDIEITDTVYPVQ